MPVTPPRPIVLAGLDAANNCRGVDQRRRRLKNPSLASSEIVAVGRDQPRGNGGRPRRFESDDGGGLRIRTRANAGDAPLPLVLPRRGVPQELPDRMNELGWLRGLTQLHAPSRRRCCCKAARVERPQRRWIPKSSCCRECPDKAARHGSPRATPRATSTLILVTDGPELHPTRRRPACVTDDPERRHRASDPYA